MGSIRLSFDDVKGAVDSPGRKEDCESTPLLTHHDDNLEANYLAALRHQLLLSEQKNSYTPVRQFWDWLLKHFMTLALLCMLVGGIVACVVYTEGAFYRASLSYMFLKVSAVNVLKKPAHLPDTICLTPACVLAAAALLQDISPRYHEIDPCTSFDRYVCEGWKERHDLRADQGSSFTGTIIAERSQQILRHLLESPYADNHRLVELGSPTENRLFKKIKDAYDACMDEERIKDLGSGPLLEVLRKVDQLFPAARPQAIPETSQEVHGQNSKDDLLYKGENNLSNTIAFLESIGVTALISFTIEVRL